MADSGFRIRPIDEADLDAVVGAAGGRRIHLDATRQHQPSVDYLLGETLIELKILEDEGFAKPQRQAKLAALFRTHEPERPVIVLDRDRLPIEGQRTYDHIVEGPVKNAVAKARRQIAQSRLDNPRASRAILLLLNNGYTTLDQETLCRLATRRARSDSNEIDGVVVGGCYFHSDGFDSFFLWPLEYSPIRFDRPFREFERLRDAWHDYAQRCMSALMQTPIEDYNKGPVIDTSFDVEGVTFVKPAPPMGDASGFYARGRPRRDSSRLLSCPPVALTIPLLSPEEWMRFRDAFPADSGFGTDYNAWRTEQARAEDSATPLQPLVPISVVFDAWQVWRRDNLDMSPSNSVRQYANFLFETKIRSVIEQARELTPTAILPHRYVLAVTEIIGQDQANDVSHLASIRERPNGTQAIQTLVEVARIGHLHALAVAAAYALAKGIESVLWQKDMRYAWQ